MPITIRKIINATSAPVVLYKRSGSGANGWEGWAQGPGSDSFPGWEINGFRTPFGIITAFGEFGLSEMGGPELVCAKRVLGETPETQSFLFFTLIKDWPNENHVVDLGLGADGSIVAYAR